MREAAFTPAGPEHVPMLLPLVREFYAFEGLPFDEPAKRAALDVFFAEPALGRAWLVHADGELAGYAILTLSWSLEYGGRDAFVDELFVREAHRGRGLGRQAFALIEDACRALGVRCLHLEVGRDNPRAIELYRRQGFVDHDRYLMTKPVPPR
jgi:GNAT superfamily N-acetyltransferase